MLKQLLFVFLATSDVLAAIPQRGEPLAVVKDSDNTNNGRIINGHPAIPGQFPWAGLLIVGSTLCSCNLVRADWVLTAGRCVATVTSGSVWFGDPQRGGAGEIHRTFVQVILHPLYNGGGANDIAMLRLETPYQITYAIQPIVLPDDPEQWFEFQWGYIMGYGSIGGNIRPDIMQYAAMMATSREECNAQYPAAANYFICPFSGVSAACNSDSGGAFVIYDNEAWRLVGTFSMLYYINDECAISRPGGFVRIAWQAGWIRWIMAQG